MMGKHLVCFEQILKCIFWRLLTKEYPDFVFLRQAQVKVSNHCDLEPLLAVDDSLWCLETLKMASFSLYYSVLYVYCFQSSCKIVFSMNNCDLAVIGCPTYKENDTQTHTTSAVLITSLWRHLLTCSIIYVPIRTNFSVSIFFTLGKSQK